MKQLPPPILPNWHPRRELSRPSAEQISRVENRKRTLTYAGQNAVIPLVYGEQLVSGPVIAGPVVSGSTAYAAIALCWAGEMGIERIEDVRLGDAISSIPAITDPNQGSTASVGGVSVRVFDGRQTEAWSQLVSAIPGFDDAFSGVAYAVVSSANIDNLMRLAFRVKGRRVFDPDYNPWVARSAGIAVNTLVRSSASWLIAGGDAGRIRTSTNWGVWTERDSQFGANAVLSIAYVEAPRDAGQPGRALVAVGEGGRISVGSASGSVWTDHSVAGVTQALRAVAGSTVGRALAVGDAGSVVLGNSGAATLGNWSAVFGVTSAALYAVAFIGQVSVLLNVWVVAGADGTIIRGDSNFGGRVTLDAGFGSATIRQLVRLGPAGGAWVDGVNRLVALGDGGRVSVSLNIDDWRVIDAGFGTANITHAVVAGGQLAALADDGSIRITLDGENWRPITNPPPIQAQQLFAVGNQLVVASGDSLRVLDLQDAGGVYTENPVRHMKDFVESAEFGMGSRLIGAAAAEAVADSLYSGIPRVRAGITIQDPMTEEDALALFSTYAEVLWSYDGRDVAIIPDAPADTIHEIPADTIREGSLQLSTAGLEEIPTQVRVLFSDREEPTWASRPAVAEIPEHQMHGLPASPSSVPLLGIYNRLEAERRAYQRLMRLQAPGRIQWQMFAPGMPYQAGDVVRLPDVRGLKSVDVRLTAQPEMIAPLLYQMGGEIYRASAYPSGATGVAVPTGGILILRGNGPVPAGWEHLDIDDRFICEGAPGPAGNQTTVSASITVSSAGGHVGQQSQDMLTLPNADPPGTDPGQGGDIYYINAGGAVPGPSGSHGHGLGATFTFAEILDRRVVRMVRRTGAAALLAPGLAYLGASNISTQWASESADLVGGYLMGGATDARLGRIGSRQFQTGPGGAHGHNPYYFQLLISGGAQWQYYHMARDAPPHTHTASASAVATLRSMALAAFESLGDAALPEGAIIGWEGATAPPGWAFCDGDNGTVDLRDRFIYITASTTAGSEHESVSEATITAVGVTSSAGSHRHQFAANYRSTNGTITGPAYNPYHDTFEGDHSHEYGGGATVALDNIQRYQLRFIQYIGG